MAYPENKSAGGGRRRASDLCIATTTELAHECGAQTDRDGSGDRRQQAKDDQVSWGDCVGEMGDKRRERRLVDVTPGEMVPSLEEVQLITVPAVAGSNSEQNRHDAEAKDANRKPREGGQRLLFWMNSSVIDTSICQCQLRKASHPRCTKACTVPSTSCSRSSGLAASVLTIRGVVLGRARPREMMGSRDRS